MGECLFCDGKIVGYSGHGACTAEYGRRKDAGMCVTCGERDAAQDDTLRCKPCQDASPVYDYRGYPPEAA